MPMQGCIDRVVCRGVPESEWRCAADGLTQQQTSGDKAASGSGSGHHTLELPHVHDHPQGFPSHCCGLPSESFTGA